MALSDAAPYAVACWTLDEASGTRADSVGSNDLTDVNTVGSATGVFSNAGDFESGNSEYLSITDNTDLSTGDITFMVRLWVQLESIGTSRCCVVKGNGTSAEYYLQYHHSTTRFRFIVNGTSGFGSEGIAVANNLGAPSTATWYLIHAWHNHTSNEIGISVNAGTANTTSHSAGVYDGSADFYIGSYPAFSQHWDGLIDDVVFLKGYILDATERSEDYNSGTGVAFADWAGGGGGGLSIPIAMRHYLRMMGVG